LSDDIKATTSGVLIKSDGPTRDASLLRARDVEFELRGRSVDPVVVSLLSRLAERGHFMMSQLNEMAQLQARMIDSIQQFSDIAGNMKDKMCSIDAALRSDGEGEESERTKN
jgi:hypothetical protein